MSNALCRLSTESIMYVLLDVAPTPEIIIHKKYKFVYIQSIWETHL